MAWRWERTVRTWSGLMVPEALRLVPARKLPELAETAGRTGLGWDPKDMPVRDTGSYLLLPYSCESAPVALWKCRVIAISPTLTPEAGPGSSIRPGRLDVSLADYRRLPHASREVERQLLYWVGSKIGD